MLAMCGNCGTARRFPSPVFPDRPIALLEKRSVRSEQGESAQLFSVAAHSQRGIGSFHFYMNHVRDKALRHTRWPKPLNRGMGIMLIRNVGSSEPWPAASIGDAPRADDSTAGQRAGPVHPRNDQEQFVKLATSDDARALEMFLKGRNRRVNLDAQDPTTGMTVLHRVVFLNRPGMVDTVKVLVRHGASVSRSDSNGDSAFELAKDLQRIRTREPFWTPLKDTAEFLEGELDRQLLEASVNGHHGTERQLIDAGADLTPDDRDLLDVCMKDLGHLLADAFNNAKNTADALRIGALARGKAWKRASKLYFQVNGYKVGHQKDTKAMTDLMADIADTAAGIARAQGKDRASRGDFVSPMWRERETFWKSFASVNGLDDDLPYSRKPKY